MAATLNFATPDTTGGVRFVLDNDWTGTAQHPSPIDLVDFRDRASQLSLDREGFVLDRVVSGVTDYLDPDQVEARFLPAARDTILRVTGGLWAVTFAGPAVRFSENDPRSNSTSISAPARAVHADLAASFHFSQFARQPRAEEAAKELDRRLQGREPRRWKVFNIWQIISPPPQDVSLALCALPSVRPEDYLLGQGYFAEAGTSVTETLSRSDAPSAFEITFLRENPDQQWGYFSNMTPGEAIIFSTFDPERGPGFNRVPHGAVTVPDAGPSAVPRSSIEVRALVVFEE